MNTNQRSDGIAYSCYYEVSRGGEHFINDHALSYQVAGSLVLHDGTKPYEIAEGSIQLIRRNQLMRFIKYPPENGAFRSLSITLHQSILKDYSLDYGVSALHGQAKESVIMIDKSTVLITYLKSLLDYHEVDAFKDRQLVDLKQKEAILLILSANPDLKHVLFDFSDPHKTDLEAFMNKNYQFNVPLERFAYLTGRSLATFKRDFEKLFLTTPGRWLLQKRLKEAHYLIFEKGKKASDIYLDIGFEDLSHFSYAFKKQFGMAPSKVGAPS